MWKINFVLLLSLVSLIHCQVDIASRDKKRGQCAFGDEYNDGCNHCICHGKSGSTCTKIPNCKMTTSTTTSPLKDFFAHRGHCSLGREFQKDCNICTCQGELGYICTRKECVTSTKEGSGDFPLSPSTTSSSSKGRCILGHRFFSGCDLCVCYGEHFGYRCSRMEKCTSQSDRDRDLERERDRDRDNYRRPSVPESPTYRPSDSAQEKQTDSCPKGQHYFDGYYYCTCRSDHLGYVCKSTLTN